MSTVCLETCNWARGSLPNNIPLSFFPFGLVPAEGDEVNEGGGGGGAKDAGGATGGRGGEGLLGALKGQNKNKT